MDYRSYTAAYCSAAFVFAGACCRTGRLRSTPSSPDGSFIVIADIKPIVQQGKGVYTLLLWVNTPEGNVALTRYALVVR
ncbi:MAG: hypothetical protein EXR67_06305 [Dehalococcoidia bacterium]|nr:hypothetical protein [Dehalococcoidia bacterium]